MAFGWDDYLWQMGTIIFDTDVSIRDQMFVQFRHAHVVISNCFILV